MIKLLTVVGARPQIIKAAALSREISNNFNKEIKETILHTGQHYDTKMSNVFFEELGIPQPAYNLSIGSNSHGTQTAQMISGIEEILKKENPEFLVLYGDTNSTLAGAIAASKKHIRVIHIEAGLRSFNKGMPEELNRIMCDHVSTLLFTPTLTGLKNLQREGIDIVPDKLYSIDRPGVFHCGDVMYDNSLFFSQESKNTSAIVKKLKLSPEDYVLITIHRANNTDIPNRLNEIFSAILKIAEEKNESFVFPIHPRTSKQLNKLLSPELQKRMNSLKRLKIIPPVSFLEMIQLEKNAKLIMTDSGGVQKEAYFFRKPVIVLRSETEWVEIIENKSGIVTGTDEIKILKAYDYFTSEENELSFPQIFGDGTAANFICKTIISQ